VIIENADFSKFPHFNQKHAELSCLMCHRAEENQAATPKLPAHTACAGCHADQFQPNSASTICSICHTDAQTGALKNFPPLKSFGVSFSHAKHTRQTNCATCHKPTRAGVALSIPSKFNAHASCFQCHAPGSEIGAGNTQSCATCHQQGSPPRAVPETAKAFSLSFSHSRHRAMACTECHNVQQGSARGRQVTAITAAMHFPPKGTQSCATCHNNKRAFGGTDFSDCKHCHQGNSFKF
jgi:c(7)-type cytochrome triheme protein